MPNDTARTLKQATTNNIALIVRDRHNPLFLDTVEEMQGIIDKAGCATLIHYIDIGSDEISIARQFIKNKKLLAIVFLGANIDRFKEKFSSITLPCVIVTNSAVDVGFDNLSSYYF